jgi:hypothetical protein
LSITVIFLVMVQVMPLPGAERSTPTPREPFDRVVSWLSRRSVAQAKMIGTPRVREGASS